MSIYFYGVKYSEQEIFEIRATHSIELFRFGHSIISNKN